MPFADGTLVKVPEEVSGDEAVLKAILPLTDVMGTGHHAAVSAGVREGGTVAVIGDGAVGLCAVLAAKRLGAERIIMLGHHEDRLKIAEDFGATDLVRSRGEQAVNEVTELTGGGAEAVAECVGAKESMDSAIAMTRPGGMVGYVGVPHNDQTMDRWTMFGSNVGVRGGVAPVRAYIPELLEDVISGSLDSSPVLDYEVDPRRRPRRLRGDGRATFHKNDGARLVGGSRPFAPVRNPGALRPEPPLRPPARKRWHAVVMGRPQGYAQRPEKEPARHPRRGPRPLPPRPRRPDARRGGS